MKLATTPYQLTMFIMIEQTKIAIINSNLVDLQNTPNLTVRLNQLLFGAYKALEPEGELFFDYGDKEIYSITRIANGKQNVGYALRDLIEYGKYNSDGHWRLYEPISEEGFQYMLDNYMEPTEAGKMISYIKEVIYNDELIRNEDKDAYKKLLEEKKRAEFLYKALVEIAIKANVKTSEPSWVLLEARKNVAAMSAVQCRALDYEIEAERDKSCKKSRDQDKKANKYSDKF